jgi:carboxyl-terminal processing protease
MRKNIFIGFICALAIFLFINFAVCGQASKARNDLYRQVELFADTIAIIQEDYVDETKPKDLIYGSLKGMLSSLDPHSQFLDPESFNELKVETEGRFGGLGIEITIKDGLLTVITPIEGTPAWKAGIKAQDKIVRINDKLTRDMSLTDAVKMMRGRTGEKVHLTVLRESQKKLLEITVVRDTIRIKDIKDVRILEDGIGYIKLIEFRDNTARELNNAIENLSRQKMQALIIDLRNNPGGLLDVAVKVCERFIPKGKIIAYTKSRKKTQNLEFYAKDNRPLLDLPMVILINEGSASGSEIVAGCLQDYKRALIIGTTSFGKGSVQTVIPLGDGSALRLTTSKYYTPLGKEIHGKGVVPDITVEEAKNVTVDKEMSESEKILEQLEATSRKKEKKENKSYQDDQQLARAVDLLKALKLYKLSAVNEKK